MTTLAKQNGTIKKETVTTARKNGAKKTTVETTTVKETETAAKPEGINVSLDERINRFEKLRGLANQRERLVNTLTELTRFNYNHSDSCVFSVKDGSGMEFKTTNTNLIKLVAEKLQQTLETRKAELEDEIIAFEFLTKRYVLNLALLFTEWGFLYILPAFTTFRENSLGNYSKTFFLWFKLRPDSQCHWFRSLKPS